MKTYAYIYASQIWEIIPPRDGLEIGQRYSREFVDNCVDITNLNPQPSAGDAAELIDGEWKFTQAEIQT
jgi:hypothetical protein